MNPETLSEKHNSEAQTQTTPPAESVRAGGSHDRSNSQTGANIDYTELKYRQPANVGTAKLAKGIGLFSIALGLAEVLAPARVGELIGVSPRYRTALPLLGVREIAHGVGIMSQSKPTESVWSRVAGDAIDLVYLGAAFAGPENNKRRLAGATVAVLGVTALDVMCAAALSKQNWSETDGNPGSPTTAGQTSGRQRM